MTERTKLCRNCEAWDEEQATVIANGVPASAPCRLKHPWPNPEPGGMALWPMTSADDFCLEHRQRV